MRKKPNRNKINIKSVVQLSLDGEFIKVWRSCVDATLEVTKGRQRNPSNIKGVCSGRNKKAYGYKWKFLEDYEGQEDEVQRMRDQIDQEKEEYLKALEEKEMEQQEDQEEEIIKSGYLEKCIKTKNIYRLLVHIEESHGVPSYIVLRRCDIDWRHYNRALYGYTDLTDQEVEKILDYVKETFGIK